MSEKRVVIVGASSGMGLQLAKIFITKGYRVGVAARRSTPLEALQRLAPQRVEMATLDVTNDNAANGLRQLISKLGGMDIFLLCSGIFRPNETLEAEAELSTVDTNAMGFARMTGEAFRFFRKQGTGHLVAITSVAGTAGLGVLPAYSATKRFQQTYLEALEQNAKMNHLSIIFTELRSGFVDTPLLGNRKYLFTMSVDRVTSQIVRAIEHKRRVVVINKFYALIVLLWRCIPRWLWVRLPIKVEKSLKK